MEFGIGVKLNDYIPLGIYCKLTLTFCISATTISGVSGIPCSRKAYRIYKRNCFQYNSCLATPGKEKADFQKEFPKVLDIKCVKLYLGQFFDIYRYTRICVCVCVCYSVCTERERERSRTFIMQEL